MFTLQHIRYLHPDKDLLFSDLNLTLNKHSKAALVGNNGSGKSTLLKLIAGNLKPASGTITASTKPYYVPQIFGQFNELTIAQALQVDDQLNALKEILDGNVTETNLNTLNDDWNLEERCQQALNYWQLQNIDLNQTMHSLSGGQKTKVMLAGIHIHKPEIILLDEPSNYLDLESRELLYAFIKNTTATVLVVSHDRTLLNLLNPVYELSKKGITHYGGNFEFYNNQKALEGEALTHDINAKEKALRKAKDVEKETMEHQHKLDARGKKKQEKAGMPIIVMKTLKNSAEKSTAKAKHIHKEKTGNILNELEELRTEVPALDKMKISFGNSELHKGKQLITATNLNFGYDTHLLWKENQNFGITSGERIAIKGANGSGKTTLIKLLLDELKPTLGTIQNAGVKSLYIDQDYSLINNSLNVFEQAQTYNAKALQEHEIKTLLTRFLFNKDYWEKPCSTLSGGEKMRLLLCCLAITKQTPDLIILDEPTNNLDLQNTEILTAAINNYRGTLLVISHDKHFLEQVGIERGIVI